MSIQSQIDRIDANIAAAYTAAADKGATMPATQNSDNLAATISSIASAPAAADYIVEQGVSNTWHYLKYNSGYAECWSTMAISGKACNTAVGSWYRTAELQFSAYPFTFSETPNVNMFFETGSGTGGLAWTAGTTTDVTSDKAQAHQFYVIRMASSASITGKVHIQVKGKWK